MARFRKLLVALDDSESSAHALRESLRFAKGDGSRVLAVAVVPPYEGDLRLVGVRSIKAVLREPCEKALARAQQVADGELGTSLWTACLEGEPHEEIVNLAE
ncbi:MAG: universal stress protein, partial [Nitrospirota bacterium]